jgi:hypothetical protein
VGHDAEYVASYLNQVDSDFRQLRERTEFHDAAMLAVARLPAGNFSSGSTGRAARERCQTNPAKSRSRVSTEQRENLEAILRQSAFSVDIDLNYRPGRRNNSPVAQ